MDLDNAGEAVKGTTVRLTLYPWNEAINVFVKDATPANVKKAAETAIKNRLALDKLSGVEVKAKS